MMLEAIRRHTLAWTTSAALTLTGLQAFTPPLFDWALDAMVVGLVALAAKLARAR